MTAHSTLGPSSAERWGNCAGSVALAATCPKSKPSIYASEGSVAHKVAEDLLTGKEDVLTLREKAGVVTVKQDGFDILIDDDMIDGAVLYVDTIKADIAHMNQAFKTSPVVSLVEKRVHAKSIDEDVWGTLDHGCFRKGDTLIIHDYKYGKGKAVEVVENDQLLQYVIGVMDTQAGWAFDKVKIAVIQPRASHADGPVREWDVPSIEYLREYALKWRAKAQKTREKDAPLAAGTWCRWCPAKAVCPEVFKEVQRQAQADFTMLPSPAQAADAASKLPAVRLLTSAQLSQALKWEDPINSWFEAVRAAAKELLESGQEVPGFKLVDKRVTRQWRDEGSVEAVFGPVLGDRLYERKILSPAKLEKIVGKKQPLVDAQGNDLTFKPVPDKTIAPSSDARREALPSAAQEFTAIPMADVSGGPGVMTGIRAHFVDVMAKPAQDEKSEAEALLAELGVGPKREKVWPQ
jgi:hypothetical protein